MEEHRLYRSRDDRMIAGVAGGIADYFDIDPSIVRLLAVVLAVIGNGVAVIAYLVMWVVVQEEPVTESVPQQPPSPPIPPHPPAPPASASIPRGDGVRAGVVWLGLLLVMVGAALFAEEVVPDVDLWGFWPATLGGLLLIAIGIRQMLTPGSDD